MEQNTTSQTPLWRRWWMITIWIVLAVILVAAIGGAITGQGSLSAPLTEAEKNNLDHCSGYRYTIRDGIKDRLKDPDSFEWAGDGLTVKVAGEDGRAAWFGDYRAKNSFGGYAIGAAAGYDRA